MLDLTGCARLAALPDAINECAVFTALKLPGCAALAALPAPHARCGALARLDLARYVALAALPRRRRPWRLGDARVAALVAARIAKKQERGGHARGARARRLAPHRLERAPHTRRAAW